MIRLLLAFALCAVGHAQSMVVLYGDSLAAGYNSHLAGAPLRVQSRTLAPPMAVTQTVPGAYVWSEALMLWEPVTAFQNHQGWGPDPAYGLALAWTRDRAEPLYIVEFAVPGSDVNPAHPNPFRSWYPNVPQGLFPRLKDMIERAALTLDGPVLSGIVFSAGNASPTPDLVAHVEAVNHSIVGLFAQTFAHIEVGLRAYELTAPNTSTNRDLIPEWAAASAWNRRVADLTTLPARTGGLPDGVHPTALGTVAIGMLAEGEV